LSGLGDAGHRIACSSGADSKESGWRGLKRRLRETPCWIFCANCPKRAAEIRASDCRRAKCPL